VALIIAGAVVSRRAFYEQFPGGRPQCFGRLEMLARAMCANRRARWDEIIAA
jgi:hypothetical protein